MLIGTWGYDLCVIGNLQKWVELDVVHYLILALLPVSTPSFLLHAGGKAVSEDWEQG